MKKNSKTLVRMLSYIKPYRALAILSFLFASFSVFLTLYTPILMGKGIDLILGKGNVDFESLFQILVKLAIIVLLTACAQWLMELCNTKITYRITKDLRTEAFSHLGELPIRYIDSHPYGDIMNRIVSDVDQVADGLLMGFSQLFTGVVTILGTIFFMLTVNVTITVLVVLITPLSLFVASFIAKRIYHMFHEQSKAKADVTSFIEEMIGNEKVVQAFAYEEEAKNRFEQLNEHLKNSNRRAFFYSALAFPSTRFINGLVYTSVGVVGAILSIRGFLSIGQLSAFLSYATQYTKPFNDISGVITELQSAFACAARILELIDEEPQSPDTDALTLNSADGTIQLEHVCFSYNADTRLIEDLNFSTQSGQRIAIVGPTGCGKSTIINLLMRFYDVTSGCIKVNDIPILDVARDSLRKNFGYVPQETWLKSGTIRENICYANPLVSDEEMIYAAKAAYAHSFIKRMPNGYDTVISEASDNLSEGQKQLLCLARVMLALPPMLILDEATSSIDSRTEIRIQKVLVRMMEGRTSFVVAHRLSTIKEADVILVMKQGKIIEHGSHEQLLDQHGFYASLYHSQ